MKIFKLPQLAELSGAAHDGEYILTPDDAKAGTTALRYGRLLRKETGRKVSPGGADTEIVYIVKGSISVKSGKTAFPVSAGEAFFLDAKNTFEFDNAGDADAVYIVACGHYAATESKEDAHTEAAARTPRHAAHETPEPPQEDDEFEITKDAPDDVGKA